MHHGALVCRPFSALAASLVDLVDDQGLAGLVPFASLAFHAVIDSCFTFSPYIFFSGYPTSCCYVYPCYLSFEILLLSLGEVIDQ